MVMQVTLTGFRTGAGRPTRSLNSNQGLLVIFMCILMVFTLISVGIHVRRTIASNSSARVAQTILAMTLFTRQGSTDEIMLTSNSIAAGSNVVTTPEERIIPGDITVFSTTNRISLTNAYGILSWLRTGSSVLMFVDNATLVPEDYRLLPVWMQNALTRVGFHEAERFAVAENPEIGAWNLPLLNATFKLAEKLIKTDWICFVNGDIMLPAHGRFSNLSRYGSEILAVGPKLLAQNHSIVPYGKRIDFLPTESLLAGRDILFTSCRFSCLFPKMDEKSLDILDFFDTSGRRSQKRTCWYYGNGAKDLFMWRKGIFERRNVTLKPYLLGGPMWDHWMVDSFRPWTVDITSYAPVLHIDPDIPKQFNYRMARENALVAACRDFQFKLYEAGGLFNKTWAIHKCFKNMNVRQLVWHLCPSITVNGSATLDRITISDYLIPGGFNHNIQYQAPLLNTSYNYHMAWSAKLCKTTFLREMQNLTLFLP